MGSGFHRNWPGWAAPGRSRGGTAGRGLLDTRPGARRSLRMAMDTAWHEAHPLPRKSTLAQRVAWHRLHAEHCGCRPIPPDIMIEIDRQERSRNKKTYRPR